ncbi:Nucleolar protein of 40 kDa [Gonapodya sp. JEL0774]|nr:Nucleolar protein of 40 kDa [Gonapodya sp. JEL0774]
MSRNPDRAAEYERRDRERDFSTAPRGGEGKTELLPVLYEILPGDVVRVEDYGCFVAIHGFARQGLVHKSQLSKYKTDTAKGVVDTGDRVWVKVISLDPDDQGRPKISLSLKYADQTTGEDRDPNNVQLKQDLKGRGKDVSGSYAERRPEIRLTYDIECRRCGGRGHLPTECFAQMKRGKVEDIVKEGAQDKWRIVEEGGNSEDEHSDEESKEATGPKKAQSSTDTLKLVVQRWDLVEDEDPETDARWESARRESGQQNKEERKREKREKKERKDKEKQERKEKAKEERKNRRREDGKKDRDDMDDDEYGWVEAPPKPRSDSAERWHSSSRDHRDDRSRRERSASPYREVKRRASPPTNRNGRDAVRETVNYRNRSRDRVRDTRDRRERERSRSSSPRNGGRSYSRERYRR